MLIKYKFYSGDIFSFYEKSWENLFFGYKFCDYIETGWNYIEFLHNMKKYWKDRGIDLEYAHDDKIIDGFSILVLASECGCINTVKSIYPIFDESEETLTAMYQSAVKYHRPDMIDLIDKLADKRDGRDGGDYFYEDAARIAIKAKNYVLISFLICIPYFDIEEAVHVVEENENKKLEEYLQRTLEFINTNE